jgi:hypothetical protein
MILHCIALQGSGAYWGDYQCSVPPRTVESFLRQLAVHEPHAIMYTGESSCHHVHRRVIMPSCIQVSPHAIKYTGESSCHQVHRRVNAIQSLFRPFLRLCSLIFIEYYQQQQYWNQCIVFLIITTRDVYVAILMPFQCHLSNLTIICHRGFAQLYQGQTSKQAKRAMPLCLI